MLAFFAGAGLLVFLFVAVGFFSGRFVSRSSDFSMAGRNSSPVRVSGILLGALVGGASTVGTTQMAYQYGMSAWWFTLGGGIGCLVLGLGFAGPLRRSGLDTIPQFLANRFGVPVSRTAMTASALGTFISVVAQFLAGAALLRGVTPLPGSLSLWLLAFLILGFIFLGGLRSYSSVGALKIAILYVVLLGASFATFKNGYTPDLIRDTLPAFPFFSLFGNSIGEGLSAGLSLVVGVLCTQIYIQAIFSASTPQTARKGALLSALLMPPLGLLGIYVGLGLKASGVVIEPAQALPWFLFHSFHPVVGGVLWGGILITVIGTAAGLSLGIATNLVYDLFLPFLGSRLSDTGLLRLNRLTLAILVAGAAWAGSIGSGSMILQWSYLSMGLRGAGTFFPLLAAVFIPDRLPPSWALAASVSGLATTIFWPFSGLPFEPLVVGLSVSFLAAATGAIKGPKQHAG